MIIRLIQALDRALYPLILILGVVIIVEPVDFAAKYVLPLMILLIIEQISVTAFDIIQWKNLKRNWKYVALRLFFVLLIIAGWDIDKYIYKH